LFTWPYNFDLFSQEEIKLFNQGFLSGLSPDALCRNVNNSLVSHYQENDSSLLKFKHCLNLLWRNQNCHQRHGCIYMHSPDNADFDSMNC